MMLRPAHVALVAAGLLIRAPVASLPFAAVPPQARAGGAVAPVATTEVKHAVKVMDFGSSGSGATVEFRPTALVPGAHGQAEVRLNGAVAKLRATFSGLPPASRLGAEYLTYVLWSVTPEGRTTNLGEIEWSGAQGQLNAKVEWHRFGLLITAEPYFAVSQPSAEAVFDATPAPGAAGNIPLTDATCTLLSTPAGVEAVAARSKTALDPAEPIVIEEARRALEAARAAGAEQYAPLTFGTATQLLHLAETQNASGVKRKDVLDTGVEAVLIAEDARVLAASRQKRRPQTDPPAP